MSIKAMTERPILFSAPMVRALLNGSKTQTRRVCKLDVRHSMPEPEWESLLRCCPYGQPGDQLWVREAWRVIDVADCFAPREITAAHRIWFESDGPHEPPAGRYRPGMFMPRWASRITLEITAVRVERLQDISEADAIAEGIQEIIDAGVDHDGWPRDAYRSLWESINGPGSWAANPWVWVVEFTRHNAKLTGPRVNHRSDDGQD